MTTPRISGLDPETASGRVGEIFAETIRQFGTVSNFSRIMALAPGDVHKPISESKALKSLSPLTDDKAAFRQWDLKLGNALNMYYKAYGQAVRKTKEALVGAKIRMR